MDLLCMVEAERLVEEAEPTCLFPWDELLMEGREADLVWPCGVVTLVPPAGVFLRAVVEIPSAEERGVLPAGGLTVLPCRCVAWVPCRCTDGLPWREVTCLWVAPLPCRCVAWFSWFLTADLVAARFPPSVAARLRAVVAEVPLFPFRVVFRSRAVVAEVPLPSTDVALSRADVRSSPRLLPWFRPFSCRVPLSP